MSDHRTTSLRPLTQLFKALADETRLRIVALLCHGDLRLRHLRDALGLKDAEVRTQLTVLVRTGVVDERVEGSRVYYALRPQEDLHRRRYLQELVDTFTPRDALREQVAALLETDRKPRVRV